MRIDGRRVDGDGRQIQVFNPYSGECIGTVPKASVADIRQALAVAKAYRPSLSRYQRAEILGRATQIVMARSEAISDLISAASGLCKKRYSLQRPGGTRRAEFRRQATLHDDGQVFSCDISRRTAASVGCIPSAIRCSG